MVLPDADGRKFLLELTGASEERGPLPVVVLSGSSSQPKEECLASGAAAFLEKPVEPSALAAAVSAAFTRGADEGGGLGLPGPEELRRRFVAMSEQGSPEGDLSMALIRVDAPELGEGVAGSRAPDGPTPLDRAADALHPRLGAADLMGRLGAAELVLLLSGDGSGDAAAALAELDPGARVGIARVESGASFEDVLSAADRELHGLGPTDRDAGSGRVATVEAPRRVTLVEDDPITAALVRHRLERSGFAVTHHDDGLAALAAIREGPPHLVVLDIRLPGMSGFEILARMRESEALARVPVLMLTSMGSESDVARGFELGADDFLVKPFSPIELVARSLRLIRR